MRKFIFGFLSIIIVLLAGAATGGYFALIKGIPGLEEIKNYQPSEGAKIYADDDTLLMEFKVEKGIYVPLKKMPEHMIKAVVAVEDSRFWLHRGVDYIAILRAAFKDILAGGIKEGGSTITQQLAKVIFLSPERKVTRKIKEAILAYRLEKNLTKEEILEIYLNRIYLGHGAYGIEMAARTYFGKSVQNISLSEAALLAGIIKAPNTFSPYNDMDRAKERQSVVLRKMQEENYISQEQADKARKQPLYLSSLRYGHRAMSYFVEYVRKYLEDKYGFDTVYKGNLRVYTTLDKRMQVAAVKALQEGLKELDKRQGFRGAIGHRDISTEKERKGNATTKELIVQPDDILPGTVISISPSRAIVKARGITGSLLLSDAEWARRVIDTRGNVKDFKDFNLLKILKTGDIINVKIKAGTMGRNPVFTLEQEPVVQGAIVAIESATGYIKALVGGYDFSKSEFNRAVFAKRQAGSAFKPIIYAAAMDHGFTPSSIIVDGHVVYSNSVSGNWEPSNYDGKYYGPTRLREALAYSRNIVTIKLLEKVGIKNVIKFAEDVGIKGSLPYDLTLALGSLSVTPLEMTSAFGVFARGGTKLDAIAVKYITDAHGNVLENNETGGVRVISPQTAFLTTSMLEDVVKYGTGWRAKELKRPVAGKTGTTNEYRDAWFIGYVPEMVAGVWVGFDDQRSLGKKETGARAASPIWVSFMKEVLSETSPTTDSFQMPEGIVTAEIDPFTGLLANDESDKMTEFFKEDSVPKKYTSKSQRDSTKEQKKKFDAETENPDID